MKHGFYFLLFHYSFFHSVASSGFYFDNGHEQSVEEFLSLEDQSLMQEEILTLLGLSHVPKLRSSHHVPVEDRLLNHTVPLFMIDIYHSLTLKDNVEHVEGELKETPWMPVKENRFQLTSENVKFINESDIIMSFGNHGRQDDLLWTRLFWFDTNELPRDPNAEFILSAELRLYKQKAEKFNLSANISVYQLSEGANGGAKHLDTLQIRSEEERWISLDVTEALISWQRSYKTNQGLLVEILDSKTSEQIHPLTIGLDGNRESRPDQEGFMVAFLQHSEDPIRRGLRMKREIQQETSAKKSPSKKKKIGQKFSNFEADFGTGDYYGGYSRKRGCQKRTLYVSFKDLGWQDWIIAPDGYSAFYCQGECSFPLSNQMNATNHAIVQTLVHLMSSDGVPKPCCAPNQLSGISVLYFDESTNVILKKFRNMVVKSCGCH